MWLNDFCCCAFAFVHSNKISNIIGCLVHARAFRHASFINQPFPLSFWVRSGRTGIYFPVRPDLTRSIIKHILLLIPRWIRNSVVWIGLSKVNIRQIKIQYLHSQSRSDKQFRTLQVNRSTHVQWLVQQHTFHTIVVNRRRCKCEGDSTAWSLFFILTNKPGKHRPFCLYKTVRTILRKFESRPPPPKKQ